MDNHFPNVREFFSIMIIILQNDFLRKVVEIKKGVILYIEILRQAFRCNFAQLVVFDFAKRPLRQNNYCLFSFIHSITFHVLPLLLPPCRTARVVFDKYFSDAF